MEQDGTGWNRMEQDGTGWNRMEQDGTGWNRMEQDGTGWNRMVKSLTFRCLASNFWFYRTVSCVKGSSESG